MTDPRYACPKCGSSTGLWEAAVRSGYYYVDEKLNHTSSFQDDFAWDEGQGTYGCACGWEGVRDKLQVLDVNDEPLLPPVPGQLEITA